MTSPWGDDKLIITKLEGYEAISKPFEFQLEMYAYDSSLNLNELVGETVTITVKINKKKRYFNGVVGQVSQGDSYTFLQQKASNKKKTPTIYTAKIFPDFWKLKFTNGFQIYQEKSINDIVKKVLNKNNVQFKNKSNECGSASKLYCVQYDESLFNFVSRLLENAGIYYFFEFSESKHEMVAGDSKSAYADCKNTQSVSLVRTESTSPIYNVIYGCSFSEQFTPKEAELNDYNFEQPRSKLKVHKEKDTAKGGSISKYPGGYKKYAEGESLAKLRLGTLDQVSKLMQGASTVSDFSAGHKFKLENHPNSDFNKEYVLQRVYHHIELNPEEDKYVYYNEFDAFSADINYHPSQKTEKPKIFGAQTAIVTGKKGEEIWVDKYGRVKVKFHWDPSSCEDEKSSCWIRVAQGWAGKNWGMLFMPRCNQEVVVSFLNGDPDCPLITGSVYNGDHMPPYLPDMPTMSTIKSNTSKGGKGFNELRFNDKKDSEEIFMHAQRDMNIEVLNAFTQLVQEGDEIYTVKKGNRTVLVQGETSEENSSTVSEGDESSSGNSENAESQKEVDSEKSIESKAREQEKTGLEEAKKQAEKASSAGKSGSQQSSGNDTLVINRGSRFIYLQAEGEGTGNHLIEIVRGNCSVHILEGDDLLEIETGDHKIKIDKGNVDIKLLEGNETKNIKGKLTHEITKDYSLTVGGNLSINVDGQISMKAGKGIVMEADKNVNVTAGTSCSIEVTEECSIKVGESLSVNTGTDTKIVATEGISMSAGEDVKVNASESISLSSTMGISADAGTDISLKATTSITANASGEISIEAGAACTVNATGTLSLDGLLVTIG